MIRMSLCFFSANECVDENMAHVDSDPDVAILHEGAECQHYVYVRLNLRCLLPSCLVTECTACADRNITSNMKSKATIWNG